ncbi:FKBP-type peptidyl-prolyl cis-trans isomerase [Sphingobacterium sp. SRCM116780]|uniref:FKBP-type peptidyl-prolyl cis-trans isomerase n=1 Tax=Sphingobacterium sp. SRCM116780 TaxID=2907623 RepID=UPI001F20204B|nr:FKBP-type peptidyl-prolyl cis-trans isomerase [Sphingobacterium sp. SRCM116780]UIR57080.1 FKBP-type peptidyl-prolyl cis-trans isomerase [Sphingobacterium sp. SRCM116780]
MANATGYLKKLRIEAKKNLIEGEVFLQENAKKDTVVSLPSGLQYEIIAEGTGKRPKLTSVVKCFYHGTLINGTVFDSTEKRKKPVSFPVNEVIAGWTEALQLMQEGSKWRLFIPATLGYGEIGVSKEIGGNATLIFEVELVSVH